MRARLVLGVLALGWLGMIHGPAQAQTPPATGPASPPASGARQPGTPLQGADASKLIGRVVTNTQNDRVGEIKSIHLDSNGVVDAVIVSVGGFLGIGDQEVALMWKDITVSEDGGKVSTALSKEQLKALPPYRYADPKQRGTAFRDDARPPEGKPGAKTATPPAPAGTPPAAKPSAPASSTTASPPARPGFVTAGDISGVGVTRASVRNPAGESIGTVEELVLGIDGAVKTVVVSVGGFLGVGTKRVAMKWTDFKIWQDKDQITLVTEATKDDLKAAPDYKAEGR